MLCDSNIDALELMALYISGFKGMPYYGPVDALELHIWMDPHTARLAEEPGCSVCMDAPQASMSMHTDPLVHSDFVNVIVKNGLLILLLLLLSFK